MKKAPKMKVLKRQDGYYDDRPVITIRESMMSEVKDLTLGQKLCFYIDVEVKELSMRDVSMGMKGMMGEGKMSKPGMSKTPKQERVAEVRITKIGLDEYKDKYKDDKGEYKNDNDD
jgi:hypothetical protein